MSWRMVGLLVLMLPSAARAGTYSDQQLFEHATNAFRQGIQARGTPQETEWFQQSAAAFEELRQRGVNSPALFLDQGNACLLANDLPGAILAYRRGLRLSPNDRELRRRLHDARGQVVYSTAALGRQPAERWPPWLPRPTPTSGWVLLFCLYGLGWILLARWCTSRRGNLLVSASVSLTLAGLVGLALAWHGQQQLDAAAQPLVVVAQDDVYLRKGNGPLYERRYETPLSRGVEARRRFERHGWLQIELAGGEVGWVPRSAVRMDEP